jgi:hypothetical protein
VLKIGANMTEDDLKRMFDELEHRMIQNIKSAVEEMSSEIKEIREDLRNMNDVIDQCERECQALKVRLEDSQRLMISTGVHGQNRPFRTGVAESNICGYRVRNPRG